MTKPAIPNVSYTQPLASILNEKNMKKILLFLTTAQIFTCDLNGQNLFFIGENSYACTEKMTLRSNSDNSDDLDIFLSKDGNAGLILVSVKSLLGAQFGNSIIIYLHDGSVIKSTDRRTIDYIDNRAKAVYYLTSDQLDKLRKSNIHTVRYTLEARLDDNNRPIMKWNLSATNNGIPTKTIITEFLEGKVKDTIDNQVNSDRTSQQIIEKGMNYNLGGRQVQALPVPTYDFQSEGIVVVEVYVDREGNVIKADAGVKGSTTLDENLLNAAREAALSAKFERNLTAPLIQKGTITYHFILK